MPMMRRVQAGMSLIEVLVALAVLTIGLLGVAALQLNGVRHGSNAQLRNTAVAQAEALIDMMRANGPGAAAGAYDTTADGMPGTTTVVADCSAADAECTPDELAAYQLKRWQFGPGPTFSTDGLGLDDQLPGGTGVTCLDATPATWACDGTGDIYMVKLRWNERDLDEDDRAVGDTTDDNLRVQQLVLSLKP